MGFAKYWVLKPCAIPTTTVEAKPLSTVARNDRFIQRSNKKVVAELLLDRTVAAEEIEVTDTVDAVESEKVEDAPDTVESATFTCASEQILIEKIKQLETLIDTLRRENFTLREQQLKRDKELAHLQMRVNKAEFEHRNIDGQIKKLKVRKPTDC
ncbi:PREDICTED: uncharacterized protein LOC108361974 [Rhagoletis zephyria]|uniref:uncharacterized protein LOC108361974 n=1 Tax=Rhagoletis zephyria TaxID=28612 RepID=UPI0008115BB3|nr:PREDICTED: uncharacterized protein LOC108361974 [Rhagoletis zephyria]